MTAPVLIGCALLLLAGALKLRRPEYTVGAVRSVRLPGSPAAVRVLGIAEIALGAATIVLGHPVLLALVAAAYAGFTGFVVRALRTGGSVASCGCVGRPDTPPTTTHLVVTTGLAVAAAVAAVQATGAGATWITDRALSGPTLALLGLTAVGTWLTWLALAVLPQSHVHAIRRGET